MVTQGRLLGTSCADAIQERIGSQQQLIITDGGARVKHAGVVVDRVVGEFFVSGRGL